MKRSFTLVEIIVSTALFAIIFISAGGIFYSAINSWVRQRDAVLMLQDARWAVKFISNEVRAGTSQGGGSQPARSFDNPPRLRLKIDADGVGPRETTVWYWRGDQADDAIQYGDQNTLYRGTGNDVATAYTVRVPLLDNVVSNPSGNDIFDMTQGNRELNLEITVRPNPSAAAGHLNRDYTVKGMVRTKD